MFGRGILKTISNKSISLLMPPKGTLDSKIKPNTHIYNIYINSNFNSILYILHHTLNIRDQISHDRTGILFFVIFVDRSSLYLVTKIFLQLEAIFILKEPINNPPKNLIIGESKIITFLNKSGSIPKSQTK